MKITHAIIVILIILSIIGIYLKINENFQNQNQTKQVLFFYTTWCKYSKMFMPIWEEIVDINRMSDFQYLKINCDTARGEKMAKDFKITQLPTIYVVKNGDRFKYTGDINRSELSHFLAQHEA